LFFRIVNMTERAQKRIYSFLRFLSHVSV